MGMIMKILNKFMDWYHGNNDLEKEPPRSGIKRVGYIIWNYSGRLILINLIFIVCCIPIITIPASITALNRYLLKIFREGYNFSISDYFEEFKKSVWKCLPYGIVIGLVCFYAYYMLSLASNFPQGIQHDMVIGIGLGVMVIGILLGSYFFVLAAMLDLPGKHLLKNAVILMGVEWQRSLGLVASIFVLWIGILATAPYSIFLVLLFGFSLQQLWICAFVNPIVEKRIFKPYEQQKETR